MTPASFKYESAWLRKRQDHLGASVGRSGDEVLFRARKIRLIEDDQIETSIRRNGLKQIALQYRDWLELGIAFTVFAAACDCQRMNVRCPHMRDAELPHFRAMNPLPQPISRALPGASVSNHAAHVPRCVTGVGRKYVLVDRKSNPFQDDFVRLQLPNCLVIVRGSILLGAHKFDISIS